MRLKINTLLVLLATIFLITSCNTNSTKTKNESEQEAKTLDLNEDVLLYSKECITEYEVVKAQREWADGIVRIGEVYTEGGDYKTEAAEFIQEMYGYDLGSVLFKPTLASVSQFRNSFDSAKSYFVGGNDAYPEDEGFAIKPYTNVKWDNVGIINNNCRMAIAMGNYYFTPKDGSGDVKVEYTFAYVKDKTGKIRIASHQSSLPYVPPKK
ncbi:phosphoribosyl-AMP cyclohydrolase [Psychroflexus montanilacus]|uniref:phosphoribosyl-AMP cyclohydrolase n=1 Tax=Psychroflexus montanilacus TaxID=2873598 RepID=UPI001CCB54D4|nr:phosphoribosyl-AMP cyclohydrolase [Psychroflexus montanilacus]MBZ9651037.1 phosphoribosyl-AMP cyclohydrolase [Psychroflexus montanilacus]